MSMIVINGQVYKGNSISINKGNIIIDGNNVESNDKTITISIEGNIDKLEVDYCKTIQIKGNVQMLSTGSGDVTIEGSSGNISTGSGDVDVNENVTGNISTGSGDVKVNGIITGNVKTMSGDIKHRK